MGASSRVEQGVVQQSFDQLYLPSEFEAFVAETCPFLNHSHRPEGCR